MSKQSSGPLGWSRMGLTPASRAGVLVAAVALQGCANLTHYNAQRDLDGAPGTRSEAILMDAKQRGVYTTTRTEKSADGKVEKAFQSFCAEPSPDALSNLAAQFGAQVSIAAKGEGSISGGFAEGAANIGLRTTSIQILRDITYRQCEAYANGGISKLGLETLQRRFQSTMVALLSIEQLTGAVRAPAVVLSGNSAANDAELIASLTQKTEAARSAVTEGEADVEKKEAEATDAAAAEKKISAAYENDAAANKVLEGKKPPTDDEKKAIETFKTSVPAREKEIADAKTETKTADDAVVAAKITLTERKQSLAAIDAARKISLVSGGTTSTTGEVKSLVIPSSLDSNAAVAVAGAVTSIVRDTLSLGYGQEVCTSIIGNQTDTTRTTESLAEVKVANGHVLMACLDLLKANVGYYRKLENHLDAKSKLIGAVTESITKCTANKDCASNTATVKELVNALRVASESSTGASPVLLTNPMH